MCRKGNFHLKLKLCGDNSPFIRRVKSLGELQLIGLRQRKSHTEFLVQIQIETWTTMICEARPPYGIYAVHSRFQTDTQIVSHI